MRDFLLRVGRTTVFVTMAGCSGTIGGPLSTPDDAGSSADGGMPTDAGPPAASLVSYPVTCETSAGPAPGRSPLRRLTVAQYDNTVRDLLGDTTGPARRLIDNERGATSADERLVTTLLAEQYLTAAEDVVTRLDLSSLTGCTPIDADCGRGFIASFLTRIFRRPVAPDVLSAYESFYDRVQSELGPEEAVAAVVQSALMSPSFLYLMEAPTPGGPVRPLDGYEMATRLSYFLWSTTPDQTLLAAAATGELLNLEGLEHHARRMLTDERAEGMMQRFFARYLELDAVDAVEKNSDVFPTFTPEIASRMKTETERFVRAVLVDGDRSWRTLMTAPWTFVDAELAEYYGIVPPAGEGFQQVSVDSAHHSGLLTQGALMASRARPYETSPVHRGMFVRGTLLCGIVPDVPEGLEVTPPDPDPNLTTRERLSEHRANPVCGSCHRQIDPLGFAFEQFDGAGRFRPDEGGLFIDTSGDLVDVIGGDRTFDGVPDLARQVVESEQGPACFSSHWLRYAAGRALQEVDGCAIQDVTQRFIGANYDVSELIVAVMLSNAFRYR
ncbi:MAG: DUF1592 domain-containing protein, partial [Myxococcota bacterium]